MGDERVVPLSMERDEADTMQSHGFTLGKEIGSGAFSRVFLTERNTPRENQPSLVVKIVSQSQTKKHNKVAAVMRERRLLEVLNHRGIVKLWDAFKDSHSLYFVIT